MYSLCYQCAYIRLWSALTTEAKWLAEIMWLSWLCYYTCGHDDTRGFLPGSHGSEASVAVVWAKFLRKVQWAVWLENEKVQDKLFKSMNKKIHNTLTEFKRMERCVNLVIIKWYYKVQFLKKLQCHLRGKRKHENLVWHDLVRVKLTPIWQ